MERSLQKKDPKQLNKWISGRSEFQLLYKASRDGCFNTAFHQKCDNKGPTVTVFNNTSDSVFGGYAAVSRDASERYLITSEGGVIQEDPWRSVADCNYENLKSDIEAYSPIKRVNVGRVNILLIGAVGSGKSSYYNTINSIFRGRVTSQACSGSAEHSLTTHYRKYKVRSSKTGKPLRFRLCDTRGLEEDQGLDAGDVVAILDGHLPDKYMFNPAEAIISSSSSSSETDLSPVLEDKIHCVVFVVDSCSVDVFPEKVLRNIKAIQQKANQRGIPQVIVLTKVDKICPEVSEEPGTLFYSNAVSGLVQQVAELVGLPTAHVLPVKNYERETKLVEQIDILALISLRQMLRFADDYLYNYLDEEEISGRWWSCSLS